MTHNVFTAAIDELAAVRPDDPAIICDDVVTTFGGLAARSRCAAAGLAELGIARGDRVALWLPNRPEWIEVAIACARLGAVVVSTNTRFRTFDLGDVLERSGAKALVFWPTFPDAKPLAYLSEVEPKQLAALRSVIAVGGGEVTWPTNLAHTQLLDYERLLQAPTTVEVPADPDAPWFLFTTSGTTQRPKFVMHSQRGILGHSRDFAMAQRFGIGTVHGTVVSVPHPLSGVLGFTPAFAALSAGACVVLASKFDPPVVAEQMLRYRVTNVSTIDEGLTLLLNARDEVPIFPDFRFAMFGALNGRPEDFVRWADSRCLRCVGSYGMTETQAGFVLQRIDGSALERAPGGGFPICSKARFRIVDPATRQLLPTGETGELEIFTPHMMLGYFENEEATRTAFSSDGYLRTGDLGFLRPDGSFRFLARGGDALRLSGFLTSPLEISSCIESHADVQRCEVVGVPLASGMVAVAFVIPEPGAGFDPAVLADYCRNRLAGYKVPKRFVPIESFPTTEGANGPKVQRAKLREMANGLFT